LKKIDELRPDKIICLGDIVGNGFYPEETVSLLRARKDVACVKGNHDIFVTMDLKNVFPERHAAEKFPLATKGVKVPLRVSF